MKLPKRYRYNPRNHCWPAIWKSIFAIVSISIALSVVEAVVIYEIRHLLGLSSKFFMCLVGIAALYNSLVLRRYILIIKKVPSTERGDPRWACHLFIMLFSFIFICALNEMEHHARAKVQYSQTLDGLTFNEAEYFYFESPLAIDTARSGQDIKADSYSTSRGTATEHSYKGYYVAPFCGHDSVFYAQEYMYSRSVSKIPWPSKLTRPDVWNKFYTQFNVMCDNMSPTTSNHLFRRIYPEKDDYYWSALGYSYAKDSICHPINEIHKSIVLTPLENDRMPRWTDILPLIVFFFLPFYILMLIFDFGCSKTAPYHGPTKTTTKKQPSRRRSNRK